MIQVSVVGDGEAAFQAAKRGFVVLGVEQELESHVAKAGGLFVLFGTGRSKLTMSFSNIVDAASKMVDSSDAVIIGGGPLADMVRRMAELKDKTIIEGKGQEAVEKAKEKLVRFNLFGTKQ